MRNYIIFAISFIVLFSLLEILSGMFLTLIYTPDVEAAWDVGVNQAETVIKRNHSSYLYSLIIAFISATIAYFVPKTIKNNN